MKPKRGESRVKGRSRGPAKASSHLVDERIRSLGGWRAEILAEVRRLIHEADPDILEECKWIKPSNPLGVPVWSHAGIVCTGMDAGESFGLAAHPVAHLRLFENYFAQYTLGTLGPEDWRGLREAMKRSIRFPAYRQAFALQRDCWNSEFRAAVEQILDEIDGGVAEVANANRDGS